MRPFALAVTGRLAGLTTELKGLGPDWLWFAVALVSSAAGTLLIYVAIGEKNATLASLIEISYPLLVAVFAWLFFRQVEFNALTLVGAGLIMGGVALVYLANRGGAHLEAASAPLVNCINRSVRLGPSR